MTMNRVNHLVAVQSPIMLHADTVSIILAILHSNHSDGGVMNDANVEDKQTNGIENQF